MHTHQYLVTLQALHQASSLQKIERICRDTLAAIGIQFFRYEWQPLLPLVNNCSQQIIACPEAWGAHYVAQEFSSIDPELHYARHNSLPLIWSARQGMLQATGRERQFWRDAHDFGLRHGVTIPLRSRMGGYGMLCTALPTPVAQRKMTLQYLPCLESFAHHLQDRMERLLSTRAMPEHALTERETEVVQWTVCGKTAEETATILCISVTTVLFHLNNAKRKLDVVNKHQLTARALVLGLI